MLRRAPEWSRLTLAGLREPYRGSFHTYFANTYFANFARSGNPNGAGLPTWTPYDSTKPNLMLFTLDGTAVIGADPWKARLDLVEAETASPRLLHEIETTGVVL
jgi:hypothetical protein